VRVWSYRRAFLRRGRAGGRGHLARLSRPSARRRLRCRPPPRLPFPGLPSPHTDTDTRDVDVHVCPESFTSVQRLTYISGAPENATKKNRRNKVPPRGGAGRRHDQKAGGDLEAKDVLLVPQQKKAGRGQEEGVEDHDEFGGRGAGEVGRKPRGEKRQARGAPAEGAQITRPCRAAAPRTPRPCASSAPP